MARLVEIGDKTSRRREVLPTPPLQNKKAPKASSSQLIQTTTTQGVAVDREKDPVTE